MLRTHNGIKFVFSFNFCHDDMRARTKEIKYLLRTKKTSLIKENNIVNNGEKTTELFLLLISYNYVVIRVLTTRIIIIIVARERAQGRFSFLVFTLVMNNYEL